jgi:predicted nuclease of predicted toxin-antitoxin system
MRLLFDQNISFRITKKLYDLFPDCKHVSDCGIIDCEDQDIWLYAKKNNFTIVTFDSDFYDISLINGHPPKIIWIRSGNLTTNQIIRLFMRNKDVIERFIESEDFKDISCLEIDE